MPNIIGHFYATGQEGDSAWNAFTLDNAWYIRDYGADGSLVGRQQIGFQASNASNIYNGSTVQPQAVHVLMIIRV